VHTKLQEEMVGWMNYFQKRPKQKLKLC
jgi:hypothetical protein